MSDLSKVLGDLYGQGSPDGPPVQREASADQRTKAASGPPNGAVDDDLAAALSSALQQMPGGSTPNSAEAAEQWAEDLERREARSGHDVWQRSDDDIIPQWDRKQRGGRGRH